MQKDMPVHAKIKAATGKWVLIFQHQTSNAIAITAKKNAYFKLLLMGRSWKMRYGEFKPRENGILIVSCVESKCQSTMNGP